MVQYAAVALVLLSLVTLPLAVRTWQAIRAIPETEGVRLNPQLGATARILLLHSLLFGLGWALPL